MPEKRRQRHAPAEPPPPPDPPYIPPPPPDPEPEEEEPRRPALDGPEDLALKRGLPSNIDAERFVLGTILLNGANYERLSSILSPEDFCLEKHRRIFLRMADLYAAGSAIDRVTVADELIKQGQLESVDGLSYIISLDEGLPELTNPEAYAKIVLDNSQLRQIILSSQRAIDLAMLRGATPSEIVSLTADRLLETVQSSLSDDERGKTPEQIVTTFPGGAGAFLDPSTRQTGLKTGFTRYDEMTNGLHPGELTILAARPSMGKTAMALNIAYNVLSKHSRAVAVFSLEMLAPILLTRLICSSARVDSHKFRTGFLNTEERRRLQVGLFDLTQKPLYIYDRTRLTVKDMLMRSRKLQRELRDAAAPLGLVIVDYLQMMATPKKGENRNIEISAISRGLKLLAMELDIPVIALSQLSRPLKTARTQPPNLEDLRDSGSIEQDADNVTFIWREELVKGDREDLKGLADLLIRKQRNGPIGNVPLRFIGAFTRFENRAEDLDDIPEE